MVRKLCWGLLLCAVWPFGGPLRGEICGIDESPGATLLLPYFEVDLKSVNGGTTLFSINNASDLGVLTHVTLWSDLGVPTFDFNVYLTGYDLQTINLRDLFNGVVPRTASHGQDPDDAISPQGERSQDLNFASCDGYLPDSGVPAAQLATHLRAAHTGHFSVPLNGCAGQNHGDDIARGYLTVDTVSRCAYLFPSSPGYFGVGGVATNQNVLWGDYYLVDPANNFAMGENLVRLEADPQAFHRGDSTFYGRYSGYDGSDAREPLASVWATRYVTGGAFSGGTDLLVWRDSGAKTVPFACQTTPPWYPLGVDDLTFFDEEERADAFFISSDPPPPNAQLQFFPLESSRVKVGSAALPIPFSFGWAAIDFGRETPQRREVQAYVATLMSADGRFLTGFGATPLRGVCDRHDPQLSLPGR